MIHSLEGSMSVGGGRNIAIDEFSILQRVSQGSVLLQVNNTPVTTREYIKGPIPSLSLQARNEKIKVYLSRILASSPVWLEDYIVSYDSLLLVFDPAYTDFYAVVKYLRTVTNTSNIDTLKTNSDSKTHVIDVCYTIHDEQHPNDIEKVANITGLHQCDIIQLHQSTPYQVFAIGFMPNFAYLGELPNALQVSRLSTPRQRVPAGAVAITDNQTAVYPSESPGGWHIIGYTAFLFSSDGTNVITPADRIKFRQIDEALYHQHKALNLAQSEQLSAHSNHHFNQTDS